MINKESQAVSHKMKEQSGFSLTTLIVALALIVITAAFAVPKFFDLEETASGELLKAAILN